MSNPAAKGEELDQEAIREKLNPGWRRQLQMHREGLHVGEATAGMGAREIIARAQLMDGFKPRKRKAPRVWAG